MKDIVLDQITKTYHKGRIKAVDGISLTIGSGELFGLIGPDGAGKTSLFRILATLMLPDSGSALVGGLDIKRDFRAIRRSIGYMPGKFSLYPDLTVEENLNFFATLFNTDVGENYDLIRDIHQQLEPYNTRMAGKLSGGMKQKLALCCALIHRPEILFLDEPTTGVDVLSRKELWGMLKKLNRQGMTILISTPYMDEASLCQRIALMEHGTIMAVDSPGGIRAKYPYNLYAVRASNMGGLLRRLRSHGAIKGCQAFGDYHHINFGTCGGSSERQVVKDLVQELEAEGFKGVEVKKIEPGIEDCFIQLMM